MTDQPQTVEQPEMTPRRAVEILTEATGHVPANRETHLAIIEALRVVTAACASDVNTGDLLPLRSAESA